MVWDGKTCILYLIHQTCIVFSGSVYRFEIEFEFEIGFDDLHLMEQLENEMVVFG